MAREEGFFYAVERPLEQTAMESKRAHAALRDYALMGAGRSLNKLLERYQQERQESEGMTALDGQMIQYGEPPTRSFTTLADWSMRFAWQERVAEWEKLVEAEADQQWAARRAQLREEEWGLHDRLFDLAKEMLEEAPQFVRKKVQIERETGREIVYLTFNELFLTQLIEQGSKLGRRAAGEPTERIEVEGASDARERLARLLDRIAASNAAAGDPESTEQ